MAYYDETDVPNHQHDSFQPVYHWFGTEYSLELSKPSTTTSMDDWPFDIGNLNMNNDENMFSNPHSPKWSPDGLYNTGNQHVANVCNTMQDVSGGTYTAARERHEIPELPASKPPVVVHWHFEEEMLPLPGPAEKHFKPCNCIYCGDRLPDAQAWTNHYKHFYCGKYLWAQNNHKCPNKNCMSKARLRFPSDLKAHVRPENTCGKPTIITWGSLATVIWEKTDAPSSVGTPVRASNNDGQYMSEEAATGRPSNPKKRGHRQSRSPDRATPSKEDWTAWYNGYPTTKGFMDTSSTTTFPSQLNPENLDFSGLPPSNSNLSHLGSSGQYEHDGSSSTVNTAGVAMHPVGFRTNWTSGIEGQILKRKILPPLSTKVSATTEGENFDGGMDLENSFTFINMNETPRTSRHGANRLSQELRSPTCSPITPPPYHTPPHNLSPARRSRRRGRL